MGLGLGDKVCIVTGWAGGIGLEVARQLREEGARVVTSGRRQEGIGELHVSADLSHPGEPERLVGLVLERFGRVDCLVNNVGGTEIHRFEDLDGDDWDPAWPLNLMSAGRALRTALPALPKQRARAI